MRGRFRAPAVACFIAVREGRLCGFAAYEATCRNFFGPLGVAAGDRTSGVDQL
jgi:hypothetical protein